MNRSGRSWHTVGKWMIPCCVPQIQDKHAGAGSDGWVVGWLEEKESQHSLQLYNSAAEVTFLMSLGEIPDKYTHLIFTQL